MKCSKPLTTFFQKDVDFKFSFNNLKCVLISELIQIFSNFEKLFLLTIDANGLAIEAVLPQGSVGKELSIAYEPSSLCIAKSKYSTIKREFVNLMTPNV